MPLAQVEAATVDRPDDDPRHTRHRFAGVKPELVGGVCNGVATYSLGVTDT